jgi:hypothetical protein
MAIPIWDINCSLLFGWAKSKQKAHHENQIQIFPSHKPRPSMAEKSVLHTFRGHQPHNVQQRFEMYTVNTLFCFPQKRTPLNNSA